MPNKNVPPASAESGQTWISPIDGMTLVFVPAGEFNMGAAANDSQAQTYEQPPHRVYLDAFWIDKYEVTNRQFGIFIQTKKYQTDAEKAGSGWIYDGSDWVDTKGANWQHPKGPGSDLNGRQEHPVVLVSWNDATDYCKWAGRRLPSEAQWEKAARGADFRLYPWGNAEPDATRLNYNMNIKDTTEVGKYPAGTSPYGALDMAGNVWEWVADWFDARYYQSSLLRNPTGSPSGEYRVQRGGSWYAVSRDVRSSYRSWNPPGFRYNILGFRCSR